MLDSKVLEQFYASIWMHIALKPTVTIVRNWTKAVFGGSVETWSRFAFLGRYWWLL